MLIQHQQQQSYWEHHHKSLFHVPFRTFSSFTLLLPLSAFVFCIGFSLRKEYFRRTTFTHCGVWNFAPSISAAIGAAAPQVYVWRLAIALHSAPRFLLALMYLKYFKKGLKGRHKHLTWASFAFNALEISGLLLLSFASSKDDYFLHKVGFVAFLAFSTAYMASSYVIMKYYWWSPRTAKQEQSLVAKKFIMITYFLSLVMALYLFYRHNTKCEPGVYSLFSICEYALVLCNMSYHFTSYLDFHDKYITI